MRTIHGVTGLCSDICPTNNRHLPARCFTPLLFALIKWLSCARGNCLVNEATKEQESLGSKDGALFERAMFECALPR